MEELRLGCTASGYPVAQDLLEAVLNECDVDRDGSINFLEFCNFLCYKETMKMGLNKLKTQQNNDDIYDEEGKYFIINKNDLVPRYNLPNGDDLIPRTISHQIDAKVGTWKTTYDIINEAPLRPEPTSKI
jgi:hypothetical protein